MLIFADCGVVLARKQMGVLCKLNQLPVRVGLALALDVFGLLVVCMFQEVCKQLVGILTLLGAAVVRLPG